MSGCQAKVVLIPESALRIDGAAARWSLKLIESHYLILADSWA